MNVIDIWNVATFDEELRWELTDRAVAIEGWLSSKLDGQDIDELAGIFVALMSARTVRGWHYTRLTDDEVAYIRQSGIYPSSLETIRARLTALVDAGTISQAQADKLYEDSPYHAQHDIRADRFWLTSNPTPVDAGGVTPLLHSWGGESVYFWQQDAALRKVVAAIGKPRVLEVAIPVADTGSHNLRFGFGVMRSFASARSSNFRAPHFDFATKKAVASDADIVIHSEGDPAFSKIGKGYPADYRAEPD